MEFEHLWKGEAILISVKRGTPSTKPPPFGFTWFLPLIGKYKQYFAEVLVLSFFIQLIGLSTPIFFQVVMDKVLTHRALTTLHSIAIGLLLATIAETVLGALRMITFSRVCCKIDAELGSGVFKHLLRLPLLYFERRKAGDSVARIKEIENIRVFLTGSALTCLLDFGVSLGFFVVLAVYSVKLTLLVAATLPLYAGISFFIVPILRQRLNVKFDRGAENHSFLIESVSGIGTIKSSAAERRWMSAWDEHLAYYIQASLGVSDIAGFGGGAVALIGKMLTLAIIWIGALQVLSGKMTVGELVAFNMIAGRVSQPIVRLAQVWNDFQQVGISMARIGDVMDTPVEYGEVKSPIQRASGAIELREVSFRYQIDRAEALRGVCIGIRSGESVGIVGRSGSGKSTVVKLLQKMYLPERGRILLDGQDLNTLDLVSLRKRIGVVPQDGVIFSRSVFDNITMCEKGIARERVIESAKMAGAHEFISELGDGYETVLGENGIGLSGGQRQRLAIARAIVRDPQILVFDEATSALDYESEAVIQGNMAAICRGRTVITIAHRLSTVRSVNRIFVLDGGTVVEVGSHEELLRLGGVYARLHGLQSGRRDGVLPVIA
jgi:subfamily B ATP-binding cassette protein HlyB/CyaB